MAEHIIWVDAQRPPGDLTDDDTPYDKLATIFQGQHSIIARLRGIEETNGSPMVSAVDYGDLDSRTVQLRIHELFGHLVRELSEAMQELDASKTWKKEPRDPVPMNFQEEMADALHFFVEMCIVAGVSAEALFNSYFQMWKKNHARQDVGY